MQNFQEDFIHFIWSARYFDHEKLCSEQGYEVVILHPGYANPNAGPDFLEARINCQGVVWNGHVEIHKKSSDWFSHKHHQDPAYDSVILHVVLEADRSIFRTDGSEIPQIELQNRIPGPAAAAYAELNAIPDRIPCRTLVQKVSPLGIRLAQERLFVERMLGKSSRINEDVLRNGGNRDLVFWKWICRGFGLRVNQDGFGQLAECIPPDLIRRNRSNLIRLEALLFGCAGMLSAHCSDTYFLQLKDEFGFLQHKYGLQTMLPVVWKFHRMRPSGFPTIRMAQLAMMLHRFGLECNNKVYRSHPEQLYELLQPGASLYWRTHYRFGVETALVAFRPGKDFIRSLFVNVLAPFQYALSLDRGGAEINTEILEMLTKMEGESNNIVREFRNLPFATKSLADTQALVHVYRNYCVRKRCVQCPVGKLILSYEKESN